MSRSFLAAIRGAVAPASDSIVQEDDEADANASDATAPRGHEQETVMADDSTKPAAASGITKADHDAAVETAHKEGMADGARTATERFSAILSAEGVKGNASRMTAAVDLAVKSPGMSAEDVTAFVTANIVADAPKKPDASLANRQTVDPFAVADRPDAAKSQAGWSKAVNQANARFGKDAA